LGLGAYRGGDQVGTVAVIISLLVANGPERHGIAMADAQRKPITAII